MSKEEIIVDDEESLLRVDPKVIQTIFLSRIERRLGDILYEMRDMNSRLSAVESKGIAFDATKIYQYATIKAGKDGQVYHYKTSPYVAFIYHVGCKYYENTYYEWLVDNVLKEKVRRTIGTDLDYPEALPMRLAKPIICEEIEWIGYNESDRDRVFGVVCDGVLYPRHVAERLGGAMM